jgi:hypothetical protein
MLRHAFVDLMDKEKHFTVEVFDFVDGLDRKALLDHIFGSASLFWVGMGRNAKGRLEHEL